MFKTFITAAAFALTAAASQAATSTEIDLGLPAADTAIQAEQTIETAYYCEWVTVYDYWGNWATVWQCY